MVSSKKGSPLFPPSVVLPAVFAPTVSHPMVDDFSLRAARQRSSQQPQIATIYQLPLRNHPLWSGNNELGREAAFAPDANNKQTILKMGEWGFPVIWTVALGLNYDVTRSPDVAFAIVAEIQFGSGGVVQVVEIDWKQGTIVTVPANAIVINASYPLNGVASSSVPSDLVLRASLSQMQPTASQPTRSYRQVHPVTTPITVVPVPPFAKDVFVGVTGLFGAVNPLSFGQNAIISFQHGTDDTPATLSAMSYPASQTYEYIDVANALVGPPAALPVPEGARSMAVVWAPGGVPANPPVQFVYRAQFRIGL